MNNYLIQIQDLTKVHFNENSGRNFVIDRLSLNITKGEILTIIAPSGYGKTTLLNILAKLDSSFTGNIVMAESSNIAYMFQQELLLPWRNILKNVLLGIEIKEKITESHKLKAQNLLKLFGLEGIEKAYPHELSGGMHQRAALAQTILSQPDLLLLDEPFSSLDYVSKLKLEIELYKIIKKENMTAIFVTHDIEEAITISDRILLFREKPLSNYEEFPVFMEDRTDPAKVRRSQVFTDLFSHLWRFFEQAD